MKNSLYDFLIEYDSKKHISFHMPGHKGSRIYENFGFNKFTERFIDIDITEIYGADNLFQAEGVLDVLQKKYSDLYGTRKSYLLINGSSAGIIAAILATVDRGETLIMARNSHKAIYNAVRLGGIKPVYVFPDEIKEYGVAGPLFAGNIEKTVKSNKDAKAIILPSPNYYGICSDIRKISDIAHENGMVLIVDEAHGAHLKFFDGCELSAPDQGADIIINSTHKTLASFTQSALLHINSDNINPKAIENKLQAIESTSPSYILMCSLDINEIIVRENRRLFTDWKNNLDEFYAKAKCFSGLEIMDDIPGLDKTKINIVCRSLYDSAGDFIDGIRLADILREKYGIYVELVTGNVVMCMTGIGNTGSDYEELYTALEKIDKAFFRETAAQSRESISASVWNEKPRYAEFPKIIEEIEIKNAEGRVCGEMIVPYPPGIPLVCPGEVITASQIEYISALRNKGHNVMGVDGHGVISVGV